MVTGGGASSFSEPLGLHVYGGTCMHAFTYFLLFFVIAETHFASHPTGIDIIVTEDFRPGFFGHAILNISWNKPTGNNKNY